MDIQHIHPATEAKVEAKTEEVAPAAGGDTIDISRISAFALTSYGAQKSVLLSLPIRGVFYGEEGFRHFFTKEAISSVDDLAGMKLRVSNDPVMNGLGAFPAVVSFGELYSALQSGVCDGAEQPIADVL